MHANFLWHLELHLILELLHLHRLVRQPLVQLQNCLRLLNDSLNTADRNETSTSGTSLGKMK